MNSARDLLRSYIDILNEAPAAPQPTPKAGLAKAPADGAMRPTGPASPQQMTKAPTGPAPQQDMSSAQKAAISTSAGSQPQPPNSPQQAAQPVAQGTDRFAAATGREGGETKDIMGDDGSYQGSVRKDPSTGITTTTSLQGTEVTDASGTPIAHRDPSLGGFGRTTYTGSGGEGQPARDPNNRFGAASGAQTNTFDAGDVGVTQNTDPSGKQTSQDTRYTMGATTINSKQGAAGTPQTFSAEIDKRGFANDQDAAEGQAAADKYAQDLQSKVNQGQTVQEEDDHEHPESARHLLKKLLKLLKDEEKIEEGGYTPGSDPRDTINAMKKANSGSPNIPKSDSQKSEAPKKSAENEKDDSEEKLAESLMHLYKAIKEGRIQ